MLRSSTSRRQSAANQGANVVSPAEFYADPEAFVAALRRREPAAIGVFFDRYARRVDRVLSAVLGPDPDTSDLVQEVFVQAIDSFPKFRGDASSLGPWVTRIAVFTARRCIRTRRRRSWLRPADAAEGIELVDPGASPAVSDALRRAYEVIETLPADERIAFTLRFVHDLGLREVAEASGVSLATVKRRLTRARKRFEQLAADDPILGEWLRSAP